MCDNDAKKPEKRAARNNNICIIVGTRPAANLYPQVGRE